MGLKKAVKHIFLFGVSCFIPFVIAEIGLRIYYEYPLTQLELQVNHALFTDKRIIPKVQDYALTALNREDVKIDWVWRSPEVVPPAEIKPEQLQLFESYGGESAVNDREPQKLLTLSNVQKVWNVHYIHRTVCPENRDANSFGLFKDFPGFAFAFAPVSKACYPVYRYPQQFSYPSSKAYYNNFGWRGKDINLTKSPQQIRIGFLGASTTQQSNFMRFSYPEFIELWLNLWAQSKGISVDFECLNAGRESIRSHSSVAIFRDELAPFQPDFVVYYEGANQFNPEKELVLSGGTEHGKPAKSVEWRLRHFSALGIRTKLLLGAYLKEPEKPLSHLNYDFDVEDYFSELCKEQLPLDLVAILNHFSEMHNIAKGIGAEFIISTFVRMPTDNLKLNPVRHRKLFYEMNCYYWPISYSQTRRMIDYQNQLFKSYAIENEIEYIDVESKMPYDPDLFTDYCHKSLLGIRLRAWITFLELLPLIEKKIEAGLLPKGKIGNITVHPEFTSDRYFKVRIDCDCAKDSASNSLPSLGDFGKGLDL